MKTNGSLQAAKKTGVHVVRVLGPDGSGVIPQIDRFGDLKREERARREPFRLSENGMRAGSLHLHYASIVSWVRRNPTDWRRSLDSNEDRRPGEWCAPPAFSFEKQAPARIQVSCTAESRLVDFHLLLQLIEDREQDPRATYVRT